MTTHLERLWAFVVRFPAPAIILVALGACTRELVRWCRRRLNGPPDQP